MRKVREIHVGALKDRDVALCFLWLDEIERFCEELLKSCGWPPNPIGNPNRNSVFRVGNEIYLRAPLKYVELCKAFYAGWIASKPSSKCDQWMSTDKKR